MSGIWFRDVGLIENERDKFYVFSSSFFTFNGTMFAVTLTGKPRGKNA